MSNVTNPSVSLLAKIGSIIAHVEEAVGDDGHAFDWAAVRSLMADHEVQDWLNGMRKMALLPVARERPSRAPKRGVK